MTKLSGIPASSVKPGDVMQLPNYSEPLTVKSIRFCGSYTFVSFYREFRNAVTAMYDSNETVYING